MSRLPLIGQPYSGKSGIASAQRCVNLYGESNKSDPQAASPFTWYPTAGTTLFGTPANAGKARCTYRTSIGTAYEVVQSTVYFVSANGNLNFVGSIPDKPSQCIMADNGLVAVLVDGTAGWAIDLITNEFAQIIDPSFYGAAFALFLDTFFCFNRPNTNQFFISLSMVNYGLLSGTAIGSGTIVGGAAYTDGVYQNVSLTGGSGTDAEAAITVSGGTVTAVDISNPGKNYLAGDILSADNVNIGGTGAGFTYTITTFALAFDPLDIAAKAGSADNIAGLATTHDELLLIGDLTTEIWIGTGAADFFFQRVQGAYIDHGCDAPYSISSQDVITFWIMRDRQGRCIVVKAIGYDVSEISTPRIVSIFKSYGDISDAIGFCYQYDDHPFYVITFPTANKTWSYDLTTGFWNELVWIDNNGLENKHRANCAMFVFDKILIGDWETGKLYELTTDALDDAGNPITRLRDFMHLAGDDYERRIYNTFDADMEVGTIADASDPQVFLSWSDDKGKTFGFPVAQSLGKMGQFLTTLQWNRLGMARDRVFRLQWSAAVVTALNGAFLTSKSART